MRTSILLLFLAASAFGQNVFPPMENTVTQKIHIALGDIKLSDELAQEYFDDLYSHPDTVKWIFWDHCSTGGTIGRHEPTDDRKELNDFEGEHFIDSVLMKKVLANKKNKKSDSIWWSSDCYESHWEYKVFPRRSSAADFAAFMHRKRGKK